MTIQTDPSTSKNAWDAAVVTTWLEQGVAAGAFPGAVARWGDPEGAFDTAIAGLQGCTRNRIPVTSDLRYDLASLTKILVTTSLALIFMGRGLLDLTRPLAAGPWPEFAKTARVPWDRLTPLHLLAHQSGLTAWQPFYRLGGADWTIRRALTLEAIRREIPLAEPGQRTIYSDLNFILLGFILEEIGGASLPELFRREVTKPLGLNRTGFRPLERELLAPTEDGFRFGGPLGHAKAAILGPTPLGQPHDDNATFLGGAAGHAGLFAPAPEVWILAADWARALNRGRGLIFEREVLQYFIRPHPTLEDSGRPLGFNVKNRVASLAATPWPASTVGHLGYTGTSLWWNYEENFMWLLFTNRVHPRAGNWAWTPQKYVGGPVDRSTV
ncbi:MAG: hypothetical protein AMR96_03295 [Candidatus Adiutrix intracellularis]|jgi:CubicO group peptidase (beta-lactamase class C family)|nr:MAG: hypothetical protein AMR96_03295 [Candidatus Adiutrix intracellularis]MDR2826786.1 beta-lactamase family protein [Candidatus Adiutrix intracellularis]